MTLESFIQSRKNAIAANFALRNICGLIGAKQRKKIKQQHRATIRRFIAELRLATNPSIQKEIAEHIKWMVA